MNKELKSETTHPSECEAIDDYIDMEVLNQTLHTVVERHIDKVVNEAKWKREEKMVCDTMDWLDGIGRTLGENKLRHLCFVYFSLFSPRASLNGLKKYIRHNSQKSSHELLEDLEGSL